MCATARGPKAQQSSSCANKRSVRCILSERSVAGSATVGKTDAQPCASRYSSSTHSMSRASANVAPPTTSTQMQRACPNGRRGALSAPATDTTRARRTLAPIGKWPAALELQLLQYRQAREHALAIPSRRRHRQRTARLQRAVFPAAAAACAS